MEYNHTVPHQNPSHETTPLHDMRTKNLHTPSYQNYTIKRLQNDGITQITETTRNKQIFTDTQNSHNLQNSCPLTPCVQIETFRKIWVIIWS